MNKELMKRKHIEESNIIMQNRQKEEQDFEKRRERIAAENTKKEYLKDRLMNQLKSGR